MMGEDMALISRLRAGLLALALLPATALAAQAQAQAARPVVEVMFVLDTTGSMARLIEGAKQKIWSIATAIVDTSPDADIRMGLVAYRDIGDEYVTKTFDLTTDIQDIYAHLLETKARGGGDWPESVNEALDIAVNKQTWTEGPHVSRIVFLVGDAPPQMKYEQDTKYPETLKAARQKDIIVNTVQAGVARDTEKVWREIAQRGDGDYIPIPQDGGEIVVIETPYDDEIIILQRDINRTVIPYGSKARQDAVTRKARQVESAPAPAASEMASYLNKRSKVSSEAVTGDGDLVNDVASGRKALDAVKDDELPEDLRKLEPAARKAMIDERLKTRGALNEKLAKLVKQRDAYVVEKRKDAPKKATAFDGVVATALKKQIKK
jgi:Mg-chelatase subunit ChlD